MEQSKTEMDQYKKLREAEDNIRRREAGLLPSQK
jgi:hypothetical protein